MGARRRFVASLREPAHGHGQRHRLQWQGVARLCRLAKRRGGRERGLAAVLVVAAVTVHADFPGEQTAVAHELARERIVCERIRGDGAHVGAYSAFASGGRRRMSRIIPGCCPPRASWQSQKARASASTDVACKAANQNEDVGAWSLAQDLMDLNGACGRMEQRAIGANAKDCDDDIDGNKSDADRCW